MLTEAQGSVFNALLPTQPRQITCAGIERLEKNVFRLTLNDATPHDLAFASVDVMPIRTLAYSIMYDPVQKITPGQPVRITMSLTDPLSPGAPLWVALKDSDNRVIASCMVAIPADGK